MNKEIKEFIEKSIEQQSKKIDDATKKGLFHVQCRREGFLEALFCIREYLNYQI